MDEEQLLNMSPEKKIEVIQTKMKGLKEKINRLLQREKGLSNAGAARNLIANNHNQY
jgi:hypothetical protein